ncbi:MULTISPECIES: DUF5366 family protein [Bacillus]|uniref:DUF5366 family protein n=1 Tax=Bacillus TaxID=1386 RepID=UPI0002DBAD3E|nr:MULTISPECIES: DUF5366 family protein [Bacillus]
MKNTYFTAYFPLIAIVLFSLSYAVYTDIHVLQLIKTIGLYEGLLEFFSESGIKITFLFMFFLLYFMVFSALKLISDTILQTSLLLFSKDVKGEVLQRIRLGSVIFCLGGGFSLLCTMSILAITLVFFITTMIAFTYFIYKASADLSASGLVGIIFFHTFIWCSFVAIVAFVVLKLYNSVLASLPI